MFILVLILVAAVSFLGFLLFKAYKKSQLEKNVKFERDKIVAQEDTSSFEFHIGDVLSLIVGVELSPRGRAGIHRILNFLYGTELYDYELKQKATEVTPYLKEQHPDLANLSWQDDWQPEDWARWLDDQITVFGPKIEIRPIPLDRLNPDTREESWKAAEELEKALNK